MKMCILFISLDISIIHIWGWFYYLITNILCPWMYLYRIVSMTLVNNKLIQYSCVTIYYSVIPYPVLWTWQQPPPARLRSLLVLVATRMTHSSRHKIWKPLPQWIQYGLTEPILAQYQSLQTIVMEQICIEEPELVLISLGLVLNFITFVYILYRTAISCKKL